MLFINRNARCAVLASTILLSAATAFAQSPAPVVVALFTGFLPGANPGMALLNTKLQTVFGGGAPNPPFSSQVFTYTSTAAAATFIAGAGPNAKVVLVGHSFGAEATFTLATTLLGPQGRHADVAVLIDYVAQSSPLAPTTPTVPAPILKAYAYHQVSTSFLEPVPSNTILGAKRNENMEVVFQDTSLVHTSIDCDARVHELVVNRIRELISPPPWPGTDEHLDCFCRIDTLNVPCQPASGIALPGLLTTDVVQTVTTGQMVTFRTLSPEGDFNTSPFGVLGEVFSTGSPPPSVVAGLGGSLNPALLVMINPLGIQTPPSQFAPMPATGFTTSFCWPAGLAGISILVQTIAVSPTAANGQFAATLGFELRGT